MEILTTVLAFLIVLSVLVLVHEFGHFVVARLAGLRVEEFGFGFPPRLFGKRFGNTLYTLNAIPLGGFVKIKGVAGDDPTLQSGSAGDDSFASRGPLQKLAILGAGIVMNLVLAVVLFSVVFMLGVPTVRDQALPGAELRDERLIVTAVGEATPAALAGLVPGDTVTGVNGSALRAEEMQALLQGAEGVSVTLEVARQDQRDELTVTPTQITYGEEAYVGIGVGIEDVVTARYGPLQSLWLGLRTTLEMTREIFVALAQMLVRLVFQAEVSNDVSGPVGIAVLTGQVASLGLVSMLQFMALLSINLALFNLLPIPALDGGRLLFVLIEVVRRKPIDHRVEAVVHQIGFLLLLLLVVLVTVRDIGSFL